MLHVALTGNIAAGKTAVAELFRDWGARLIDADEIVREVQAPNTPGLAAIAARFGPGVIAPDGTLDRAALRQIAFADPAALADLNAIVHPAVQRRRATLLGAARAEGAPIVVSVIPLLFESADPAAFDAIVLVDAPAAMRRDRLLRCRGLSPADADRMLAAGAPAEPKRGMSDYVIDNDADLAALERRARDVWTALQAKARLHGA